MKKNKLLLISFILGLINSIYTLITFAYMINELVTLTKQTLASQ